MKWIKRFRYWLIRCLVGNMPVMANVRISNWDFYNNKDQFEKEGGCFMFYGNHVYILEKLIHQRVYTGNKGKVTRNGNMFVLEDV